MSLLRRIRRSLRVGFSSAAAALAVSALAFLGNALPAHASTTQLSIFDLPGVTDTTENLANDLQIMRSLGVNMLQVGVGWSNIAPDPTSRTRPAFNAADPNAYPAANWTGLDRLVNQAASYGIRLDFVVQGGAPLWATQTGGPPCRSDGFCYDGTFKPSASEFGQFVQAVATRYPSVHFWDLWNEANWGPSLTPQYQGSSVPASAPVYRGLLDAGWNALHATGHSGDTIVASSLSQDGSGSLTETGTTAPLIFVRTLYCADSSYRHLSGAAAAEAGCPTTAAGYQQFKTDHPALFGASGVGIHPYPYGGPPTHIDFPSPDGLEFGEIPQLTTTLDRLQRLYIPSGPYKQMNAFNDEYGYRTKPNDTQPFFTTPENAAAYINQAEYLSWKNPRIGSYDQYELYDGSWFPTGLFFAPHTVACPGSAPCPKPSFSSYRLPVWLPVTAIPQGHATEVWGNARPAYFARIDTGQPQSVQIQWAPAAGGQFKTVATAQTSALGYFDTQVKFPGAGQVRLAWQYPLLDLKLLDPLDSSRSIYSRVTNIAFYQDKASGYLRGVFNGHTKLGLTIKRGTNAPSIQSVSVRPPHGLKLKCVSVKKKSLRNKACSGLALRGVKVNSAKVAAGKFVLTLAKPASKVSITAGSPFVNVTSALRRSLRKHRHKRVTFTLLITDTNGAQSTIALRLKAK